MASFIALGGLAPRPVVVASDGTGIYACVEQVVVEEAIGVPPNVRVFGVFSLAIRPDTTQHGWYTAPKAGYMYWHCPPDKIDICRLEWRDLAKAVGTGKCAAFGQRPPYPETGSERLGRIRPYGEPPKDPEPYPLSYGVSLVEAGPTPVPGRAAEFSEVCALNKAYRLTATAPPPVGTVAPQRTEVVPTQAPSASPAPPTDAPTAIPTADPKPTAGAEAKPTPGAAFVPQAVGAAGSARANRRGAEQQAELTVDPASHATANEVSTGADSGIPSRAALAWQGGLAALVLGAATLWTWRRRAR